MPALWFSAHGVKGFIAILQKGFLPILEVPSSRAPYYPHTWSHCAEGHVSVVHTTFGDPSSNNSNTLAVTGDPGTLQAAWEQLPAPLSSLLVQYPRWTSVTSVVREDLTNRLSTTSRDLDTVQH